MDSPRRAPAWLFGITNIPFGVAGGFIAVALPKMLRDAGVPVDHIAGIVALCLIPSSYQFFWAPIIDIGPRRRTWLVLMATVGGLCLGASLFLKLPEQLSAFVVLAVAGQGITGMVGSCNGGLMATTLPDEVRGKASGWFNAGNLGGSALGGGLVLTAHRLWGLHAAGVTLFLLTAVPSLSALLVPEAKRVERAIGEVFRSMLRDVWATAKSRQGWTGILFCLSPVGTVALLNLFAGVAVDYHASDRMAEWINGYWGGLVTAGGAAVSGMFLDRVNRRYAYLAAGILTAIACFGMMSMATNPRTYAVGVLVYLLVAGFCYAAFSSVVLEIIGQAGHSAATQYTLFTAAGNQAIAYTTWFDGKGYKAWGTRGLLGFDALANLAGVCALFFLLRVVFRKRAAAKAALAA